MNLATIERFQDAIVTLMGMGRYAQGSGLETAKWLMRHGAQIVITDLKDQDELKESVDVIMEWFQKYRTQLPNRTLYQPLFILGQHREEDFVAVDCVMQTPGVVSERQFVDAARAKGVAIESDTSLFFRYYPYPTVAVTGTRGKTTATMLVHEMLRAMDAGAVVAGNVQTSPLALLDDLLAKGGATPIVIELSSWMLESLPTAFTALQRGPDIAVLTNMYADHLGNRYANFAEYIASKEILFAQQTPSQYAVLNYDHKDVRALGQHVKAKRFWCSAAPQEGDGCYVINGNVVFRRDGQEATVCALADVALKGDDQLQNVLAATCAAMLRGVTAEQAAGVLKVFAGVSARRELVREVDEIAYVNDAASITPAATADTLRVFGGGKDVVLLAGGEGQGDVASLVQAILESCQHVVLFPGALSQRIEEGIRGKVPMEQAVDMASAVRKARAVAQRGDIVVLSPGADVAHIWETAYECGEAFREEVRTL